MSLNLIDDAWLAFRRRDGSVSRRPPTAVADNDVIDLALPRADFTGSAWQFLIGLLQTAFAPADTRGWAERWRTPPTEDPLRQAFAPFQRSFELLGDGPRFMQDLDSLETSRAAPIDSLLIEAPGEQGIKQNTDHFVKRSTDSAFCLACTAQALMTMQMVGPAGGTGYRVGVRGGGPLTTLVLPHDRDASLWHKLWLNVLARNQGHYIEPKPDDEGIFPWLAPTRTSEKSSATPITTPDDAHWLQLYWAMPNRFRLVQAESGGDCRICGGHAEQRVSGVRVTNYGVNYDGPWQHPLTPYRFNPKKPGETPFSQKGQQGGLGYRHWEMFTIEDHEEHGNLPATVVRDYLQTKQPTLKRLQPTLKQPRLRVFGYDMKQNKPRGWYATEMPLVTVDPAARELFFYQVRLLTGSAEKIAWYLREAVKAAWFAKPSEVKGDFDFIQHRFWEATTEAFYHALPQLVDAAQAGEAFLPQALAERWYQTLRQTALDIFDDLALAGETQALDLKRVFTQRNALGGKIANDKTIKPIRQQAEGERVA